MTIRVLIVDDEALIRSGLGLMIESQHDIRVVDEAEDGREAVELALRHRPDVILMDVQMPHLSGIDATRRITAVDDPPRVVVLTTFGNDENVLRGTTGRSQRLPAQGQPTRGRDQRDKGGCRWRGAAVAGSDEAARRPVHSCRQATRRPRQLRVAH